jgi:hypothetical protein
MSEAVPLRHPLTLVIPAGAHINTVRPFGGEKVHWAFCFFLPTFRRERDNAVPLAGIEIPATQ